MFRSSRGFDSFSRENGYFFDPNPPTLRSLLSGGEEFSVPSGNRGPSLMGRRTHGQGGRARRMIESPAHTHTLANSSAALASAIRILERCLGYPFPPEKLHCARAPLNPSRRTRAAHFAR
ncbi:hypothetical protein AVEN_264525-1 [Araneus ventricosus]|uniref:Uncharacterized protein n=1 Tax=Araneus ventricosus TaxID=182803 RepID=A0A4Y2G9B5_ARAVE|nr:hypothetical protein AVEN_264525-1 [Araneus ventricosus]